MRVSIWPIRIAGSWGYMTGSWWEITPYFTDISIDIRENESLISNLFLFDLMN